MKIHFITPTRISLINLTTIGDSEKRNDETKIGKFSSGQAYATALLLRESVGLSITIYGGQDEVNGAYTEYVDYSTIVQKCDSTNKSKEVIQLEYNKVYHLNATSSILRKEGIAPQKIKTAFALQLGYNWNLWMAYRELMSNVLDEGGYVKEQEEEPVISEGTVISLDFEEGNAFHEVWKNRHLYMNFEDPLFKVSESVEALSNEEGYLRIYKQNILVYEDKERSSRFAWNIKFGEIDERRILSNIYTIEQSISSAIQNTDNEDFLRVIITNNFSVKDKEFLANNSSYSNHISESIKKIVNEVNEEYGEVKSYDWLIDKVKKQKDCKIPGKKIKTVEDHIWSYSSEVVVETIPESISLYPMSPEECYEVSFIEKIKRYYDFTLDVEVKTAKLRGSKVVADKYEKCLIIDTDFNIEEDFHYFIVEYLDLTQSGNVVTNLSKYICSLIKIK